MPGPTVVALISPRTPVVAFVASWLLRSGHRICCFRLLVASEFVLLLPSVVAIVALWLFLSRGGHRSGCFRRVVATEFMLLLPSVVAIVVPNFGCCCLLNYRCPPIITTGELVRIDVGCLMVGAVVISGCFRHVTSLTMHRVCYVCLWLLSLRRIFPAVVVPSNHHSWQPNTNRWDIHSARQTHTF